MLASYHQKHKFISFTVPQSWSRRIIQPSKEKLERAKDAFYWALALEEIQEYGVLLVHPFFQSPLRS